MRFFIYEKIAQVSYLKSGFYFLLKKPPTIIDKNFKTSNKKAQVVVSKH